MRLMEILMFMLYNLGFAFVLLFLCLILILIILKIKKEKIKFALYYPLAVLIALFLYEFYPYCFQERSVNVVFSGTYADNKNVSGKKEFVGYGPIEDSSFQVSAIRKKRWDRNI